MKKQIMRYRLIADQKVGRASKNEVLSDDLLKVEKHIEHVRSACQSTYKKLSHCMQSHGIGDYEKRLKRLSENTLAQAMNDASASLLADGDSYQGLGVSFEICAKAQSGLAKEKAMYEMFIDEHVISPLQALVDTEIPTILKQREKLKKLVLDRDNANQNYLKANKAQYAAGANPQQSAAKLESMRDEYDQASLRMEQCKDQLVTEMFEYLSKEVGHSQRIADFHAKQLEYHRRCVSLLEKLEPDIKAVQEKTVVNSSFGRSLNEHLKTTERVIASPIEACVLFLLEYGVKEEGIFRIAGGAAKLKKIRSIVDGGVLDLVTYDAQDDVHAVAGALKQYLRELPNPLLTYDLHDKWIAVSNGAKDNDEKLREIKAVIDELPPANKANLKYLIKFCSVVSEHHEINKMTASNLAVVLAPNLLWSNIDDIAKRMVLSNIITSIVEVIISNAGYLFPEEIDFVVTPNATAYNLNYRDNVPVNDTKSQSLSVSQPAPVATSPVLPKKAPKPVTVTRTPSGSGDASDAFNSGTLKSRKQKSKAPPPPQQTQAPPPKPQDRPPLTLPSTNSPAANGATPLKQPTPAKRMSMRKPHLPPPPNPPKENSGAGEPPISRPRPPGRKPTGHSASLIDPPPPNPKTVPDADPSYTDYSSGPYSPPMPSNPPPPLPEDVEMDLGVALTTELHL